MKKIVLTFGLIAGFIFSAIIFSTLALCLSGKMKWEQSEIIGYTTMVLAFSMVFFGIRSYRENSGGTITFLRGVKVGLLITLVACAVYVISWEIVYFGFTPEFYDEYSAHMLEKMRADGKPEAQIEAERKKMADFKPLYDNPLINSAVTFVEAFPVGLVVTLVSAAILRKKALPPAGRAAAAMA